MILLEQRLRSPTLKYLKSYTKIALVAKQRAIRRSINLGAHDVPQSNKYNRFQAHSSWQTLNSKDAFQTEWSRLDLLQPVLYSFGAN